MADTVKGSCLCGVVQFEVTLPTLGCCHCHCSISRRFLGAAYGTFFQVPRDQVRLVAGESHLRRHRSSPWAQRAFCASAGPRASNRCPDPRPGSSPARLVLQPEAARDTACATRFHHGPSDASPAVASRAATAAMTMTADTRLCSRKTLAPRFERPPSGRASPALAADGGEIRAWLVSALGAILRGQCSGVRRAGGSAGRRRRIRPRPRRRRRRSSAAPPRAPRRGASRADRASPWRRASRVFVCRPRPVAGHGSGRSGTLRTRERVRHPRGASSPPARNPAFYGVGRGTVSGRVPKSTFGTFFASSGASKYFCG